MLGGECFIIGTERESEVPQGTENITMHLVAYVVVSIVSKSRALSVQSAVHDPRDQALMIAKAVEKRSLCDDESHWVQWEPGSGL